MFKRNVFLVPLFIQTYKMSEFLDKVWLIASENMKNKNKRMQKAANIFWHQFFMSKKWSAIVFIDLLLIKIFLYISVLTVIVVTYLISVKNNFAFVVMINIGFVKTIHFL